MIPFPTAKPHFLANYIRFPPTPQNPSMTLAFPSPKTSFTLLATCFAIVSGVIENQLSSSILIPLSYLLNR